MHYFQVTENNDLPDVARFAPFKVVLVVEDPVSRLRQHQISRWLVTMGGLYVMICGEDCDSWKESIRRANLDQVPIDDMLPEQFVMITTHPGQRLRGIYRHADKFARHTHAKIEPLLTVHVGCQDRSLDYRSIYGKD